MKKRYYLNSLLENGAFRFNRLIIKDIDNTSILNKNRPEMAEEEIALFHQDISSGDIYLKILYDFISERMSVRNAAPVVRFADGEYAFYAHHLHCNGLYQQVESVKAIKEIMPLHIEALKILNQTDKLAPLIYPGNSHIKKRNFFSFLRKSKGSALEFLEFLFCNSITLTLDNYLPFYVVYAYLTSKKFSEIVNGKKLCIINSEYNADSCKQWFARFSSSPHITFVKISNRYVATQWSSIKENCLRNIPKDTDICLVGAGIGSLLVCVDIANTFSIPTIDAGHILNMMNQREDKSKGPRLYTIRKKSDE